MDFYEALSHVGTGELIIAVIIFIVTAWIYFDPEKRTRFFLSNPSMAITIYCIAVLISPTWYSFEFVRQLALVLVVLPWLIMCTFAYGFRLYFYILTRMIEESKRPKEKKPIDWKQFAR